tara:strand:- start:426 stop:2327 length:1902 start_codon:yes stop_codon:yes gene_type:complete
MQSPLTPLDSRSKRPWFALLLLVLFQSQSAQAFKCTETRVGGPSLYWADRTVTLVPAQSPGQDLTAEALTEAVTWGASQWTSADFRYGVECSDFTFEVASPPTADLRAGYDWHDSDKNQNLIVYRRGADHDEQGTWFFARSAIAMTTVTYVQHTGEILDADIEINDQDFRFTDCHPDEDPACDPQYDLKNTITHELGHVLGLAHPALTSAAVREATMYAAAPVGDVEKRDLAQDDLDGLCTLYPFNEDTGNCGEGERENPPPIVVTEANGCNQNGHLPMLSLLALCLFFCFPRGPRKLKKAFLLCLLLPSAFIGCFDRTTNTWENEPLAQPDVSLKQSPAANRPAPAQTAFFHPPKMVASPGRGRLGILHLHIQAHYSPIAKLTGQWGVTPVSTMPWSQDKRLWQVFFPTPVGETAQDRELALEAELQNGQKVRFVKRFTIDHIIYDEDKLTVSKKYIQPARKVRARIRNEKKILNGLWQIDTARRYWQGNFLRPSSDETVTAHFGTRRTYNGKRKSRHLGIDWDGKVGDPVVAAQTGRVMLAQNLYYSGNTIVIDHGRGLFSLYFHLSAIETQAGDMAFRGQIIGKVGATGQVTGPHLHFAVKLSNTYVDPAHILAMDFSSDPALEKNVLSQ